MLRKEIISTLIGLAIFGALTGLLLEVMIEGDAAKFKQFTEKIKGNTLILFETAQMATVQNMITKAHVGFELSKTLVDPDLTPNNGDEFFLNQVSECVFSSPEDIPFPTCLICQLSDKECMPKVMCPECIRPTIFTVRYDNPTNPNDVVRIEVYKNISDFGNSGKLLAEFDGVMNGDEITIDGRDFGKKDTMESNTAYRVLLNGQEVAGASIHTSCSKDLFVGDVHLGDFGVSFTVVSGTDANLNPTIPDALCAETSKQPGVNILVEGKKILDNGYVAGTIETIPLPTGPAHLQNDIQNVHCVVLKVCGPPNGEGCTPGYWRHAQHFGSWVNPPYSPQCVPLTTFREAFGLGDFEEDITMKTDAGESGKAPTKVDTHESSIDDITLLDAIWALGDDEGKLARHATAALLNAANENVDYGLPQSEIIRLVQVAFGEIIDVNGEFEEGDFNEIGSLLAGLNDLGDEFCPLGRADLPTDVCEI